jgi:hypothetical protein
MYKMWSAEHGNRIPIAVIPKADEVNAAHGLLSVNRVPVRT